MSNTQYSLIETVSKLVFWVPEEIFLATNWPRLKRVCFKPLLVLIYDKSILFIHHTILFSLYYLFTYRNLVNTFTFKKFKLSKEQLRWHLIRQNTSADRSVSRSLGIPLVQPYRCVFLALRSLAINIK